MRCAFITNGIVCNVAEFLSKDDKLAKEVAELHGCETWKFDETPSTGWSWDGKKFIEPPMIETPLEEVTE